MSTHRPNALRPARAVVTLVVATLYGQAASMGEDFSKKSSPSSLETLRSGTNGPIENSQLGGVAGRTSAAVPVAFAKPAADDQSAPTDAELEALVSAAKFLPPSSSELEHLKTQLTASLAALNAYLDANGANGQAWKRYLGWDDLQRELNVSSPRMAVLREWLARYRAIHNGLELSPFTTVRGWLRLYTNQLAAATDPQAQLKIRATVAGSARGAESLRPKARGT